MKDREYLLFSLLLALFVTPACLKAQFHIGDIGIGRSSDGKLKVTNVPDPIKDMECLDAVSHGHPLFSGWLGNDAGFDHITVAGPDPNFFPLQSGAQIYLYLINGAEGFQVVNALNLAVIDDPGEQLLLGGSTLHIHPFWNFNTSLATGDRVLPSDFAGRISVTFKLIDGGSTGYDDSQPFVMTFSNDPNPFADINEDGIVDPLDVVFLSNNWLNQPCNHPHWCDRADIDQSGVVDLSDFVWAAYQWMETQGCV
jgi:hypothetical protein